jgi:hypothetical protein
MKYELVKGFNNHRFRQATGVNIDTLNNKQGVEWIFVTSLMTSCFIDETQNF